MSLPNTLLNDFDKSMKNAGFADSIRRPSNHHYMNSFTITNGKKMRMVIVMELVY